MDKGKEGNQSKSSVLTNWVEQYGDELYSWALYKTSSKVTAEDLVQETFAASINSFESFRGDSSAKTWLFAILNRQIIDYYRKNAKMDIVSIESEVLKDSFENGKWKLSKLEEPELKGELLDDSEFLKIYEMCLNNLNPQWAMVMHLKFVLNKKSKEVCQDLNITESNLWQIVHRSKLKLKDCLTINWSNH